MADKVKKYRLKARSASNWPDMGTLVPLDLSQRVGASGVNVVKVALSGNDVRITLPAKAGRPPVEQIVKGATQAQLKYLYEVEANPHIEEYED